MTEKHHLLTNDDFERKFSNCELPGVIFTHEAHLRISYIHITKYGLEKAIDTLSMQIKNCDDKYGNGTKFNKKLTIASTKVIHHFIAKSKTENFNDFIKEFPQLKSDFLDVLKTTNAVDILNTKNDVKEEYLESNLLAIG